MQNITKKVILQDNFNEIFDTFIQLPLFFGNNWIDKKREKNVEKQPPSQTNKQPFKPFIFTKKIWKDSSNNFFSRAENVKLSSAFTSKVNFLFRDLRSLVVVVAADVVAANKHYQLQQQIFVVEDFNTTQFFSLSHIWSKSHYLCCTIVLTLFYVFICKNEL